MRKMVMTAISLAVLGYGNLMAQEKAAESVQAIRAGQLEKLGAMKGRIQSKVIELQKLMDPTQNGAAAVQAAVQKIHLQATARLAKLVLEENAKPQEMRNMAQVDNYNNRTQKLNEMLVTNRLNCRPPTRPSSRLCLPPWRPWRRTGLRPIWTLKSLSLP